MGARGAAGARGATGARGAAGALADFFATPYPSWTVAIVVHLLLIGYIARLGALDCECADAGGWRARYIFYTSCLGIVLVPLAVYVGTTRAVFRRLWASGAIHWWLAALGALGALKAYAMFDYSLTIHGCECARDWRRTLLLWQGILAVLSYAALVLLLVYAAARRFL